MPSQHDEMNSEGAWPDDPRAKDFFVRLSTHLQGMPDAEREDRLREVRHHLALLISAHQVSGASGDDAVSAALSEMGDAGRIGLTLMRQWQTKRRRTASAAFYITTACNLMALAWLFKVIGFHILDWRAAFLIASVAPVAAGVICGLVSPRATLRAALLSASVTVAAVMGTMAALDIMLSNIYGLSADVMHYRRDFVSWLRGMELSMLGLYFLVWLPSGCLSAVLRRRLLRPARSDGGVGV